MSLVFNGSRIHLAHGELPEALTVEFNRRALSRVLLIVEQPTGASSPQDQIKRALPDSIEVVLLESTILASHSEMLAGAKELFLLENCDSVLVFGHRPIIEFAKHLIRNVAAHLHEGGNAGGYRFNSVPYLIAVPSDLEAVRALGPSSIVPAGPDGALVAFFDQNLVPDVAVCDQEFLHPLPRPAAIALGMGILCDGIEACTTNVRPAFAEALTLDAIRRARTYLELAAHGGSPDPNELLLAALAECVVPQRWFGAAHAIATAIWLAHPTAQGRGCVGAVILPIILERGKSKGGVRTPLLNEALGRPAGATAEYIRGLAQRLNLPLRLSDFDVRRADIGKLAQLALSQTESGRFALEEYATLLDAAFPEIREQKGVHLT